MRENSGVSEGMEKQISAQIDLLESEFKDSEEISKNQEKIIAEQGIVCDLMQKSRSPFMQALGDALMIASSKHANRIKAAFPEYWEEYLKLHAKKKSKGK